MTRIFKYPFTGSENGYYHIEMPIGANVIHIDKWATLCIWAEIDTEVKEKEKRHFIVIETGEAFVGKDKVHCGTVLSGGLVQHVYEVFDKDKKHGE